MWWSKKKSEKSLGQLGEDMAVKFLKKQGYKIIARNYCNTVGRRLGEIDIVAKKNGEIVFIEVKTRNLENYSGTLPEANITPSKLHKLNKIANNYIRTQKSLSTPYHFDALSIWIDSERQTAKIKHLENIFI